MRIVNLRSRALFVAGVLAMFFSVSVRVRPAQSQALPPENRVYAYHGQGSKVSEIQAVPSKPDMDRFKSASSTGSFNFSYVYPHFDMFKDPTKNPDTLIGVSPGNQGIWKLNPNGGAPVSGGGSISTKAGSLGVVKSGVYVRSSPMKPHYFAVGDYSGSPINSSILEFYDPLKNTVVEAFLPADTINSPTGAAFAKIGSGAGALYRYFWSDKSPTSSTADSIFYISLTDSQIVEVDGSDPWNPAPSVVYGPPFPQLSTQIGGQGWSDSNKGSIAVAGNDDDTHRLATWTHPGTGVSYLFFSRSVYAGGTPPAWAAVTSVYNINTTPPTEVSGTGYIPGMGFVHTSSSVPPIFHEMRIIGNYLFVTFGTRAPNGLGGTTVSIYFLGNASQVGLISGATTVSFGASGRGVGIGFPGATGIGSNADHSRLYLGSDNASPRFGVAAVNPATQDIASGLFLMNDPGAGTSAIVGIPTEYIAMTPDEEQLVAPPDRLWPGRWFAWFKTDIDPVSTFPGTGVGNLYGQGDSSDGACSGSTLGGAARGNAVFGIALLMLVVALAVATLREASAR